MRTLRAQLLLHLALSGVVLLAGGAGCARNGLPAAGQDDVARAASRWPGTTAADLDRGRRVYRARCSSCHLPVPPEKVPSREWPEHVSEMKERAGLDDHEATLVVRYLVTMSEAGAPAPPPDGPGGAAGAMPAGARSSQ